MSENKKRVVFLDDKDLPCRSFRLIMDKYYDIETICGCEEDIDNFYSDIGEDPSILDEYDLVMVDLIINGKTGLDIYKLIKSKDPDKKVIIFSGTDESDNILDDVRKAFGEYFEPMDMYFVNKGVHMADPMILRKMIEAVLSDDVPAIKRKKYNMVTGKLSREGVTTNA